MSTHSHSQHRAQSRNHKIPNLAHTHAHPLHAPVYRLSHRLRTAIIATILAALTFVGTASALVANNITTLVEEAEAPVITQSHVKQETIVDPNAGKPINILVLGQDTRSGEANAQIGAGGSADDHQSDTAMIVQLSADRTFINIVSIPRDSIVDQPSCNTSQGVLGARNNVMFNSIFATAYQFGGDLASAASCTMNAVNALTGLEISQFVVVDFAGLSNMISSLGGVDICIAQSIEDDTTGLHLQRGLHHLNGVEATQYARVRHGVTGADGSDIYRTTRQQFLIKSLLREAKQKNLFTQTNQLYQLATSAIQSLTMSPGLADVATLVGMSAALTKLNTNHIYARTVPVTQYVYDKNRVVWTDDAVQIWDMLKNNKPLTEDDSATQNEQDTNTQDTQNEQEQESTDTTQSQDTTLSQNGQATATPQGTLDANTGLLVMPDGSLVDPNTNGYVDPDSGVIKDANTGQAIGMADGYVSYQFCGIPVSQM
ncbi:transcriptional regulator [Galliscardovia ingluviei]|uniref:Transcriptional regulator n=1 Tax=Galliscardovia ingluviei TaxID=1769422 RepID=A0A8J3AHW7_9BIFI|nr:LCP family protein [Galliscardovia ingluviei]GGI13658.1 transcriptional regulator [Galliscardovia ingluviei]